MDNLFLHCQWERDIWTFLLSRLNIAWAFPRSVSDIFLGWGASSKGGIADVIWCYLPEAIYWMVWKERNHRIFNGIGISSGRLCLRLYELGGDQIYVFPDFCEENWAYFFVGRVQSLSAFPGCGSWFVALPLWVCFLCFSFSLPSFCFYSLCFSCFFHCPGERPFWACYCVLVLLLFGWINFSLKKKKVQILP